MKVSIIIPVYNTEKYLEACIESCINQTYKDIEIILVDDGSTDNSQKIIMQQKHKHPDLITVISKNNGGTGSALNVGIDNMKGEWFKWVSADDVLIPTALENMLMLIDYNNYSPQYLFYTDYDIIDENSKIISMFKDKEYEHQAAELYHNFFGNGSTSLIHRNMFGIVGKFNETMPYNDDYEFWLRWVLKYGLKMKYLPITTLRYRVHPKSLTNTKSIKENQKLVDELRKIYYQYLYPEDIAYIKTLKRPLKKRIIHHIPFPILKTIMRLKK